VTGGRSHPPGPKGPPSGAAGELVLVHGVREARGVLARWARAPGPVLGPWLAGALLVAVGLLSAVWVVSLLVTPDATPLPITGVSPSPRAADFARLLGDNLLVLALHATACIAGFIAGASLPNAARRMTGFSRFVHERAGPVAIAWVVLVTTFSLLIQALTLGLEGATLAGQLGISSGLLILTVLPHALLELTAIFLPLAAWLVASRRDEWEDLLAATFVTVAVAIPMLLAAATVELYVWPQLLIETSPWLR
jgi:hypothetical protein